MSDNIKVVVKVRPLIPREIEDKLSFQWRVKNNTLYQLDACGKESGAQFTFDKVYDEKTKTADVYKDVAKPIVEAAIAGFNGTIFAYGQTSSGKTYTMSGTDTSPGIIELAVLNLFEQIKSIPDRDFLVRVSYIEIYNETLKDLLNEENDKIKVRDTLQGVRVDATEKFTSSPEEVMEIMKEGEANRQIGATNMNEESSRSHSIFQITIESREHIEGEEIAGSVNVSILNLVDLAGSERSGQTGATGKRFKEGTHINKSLSVLALVIKQLSEDPHKHANYRDSKLTRILQNSLGGNAKTSIICAVTPAAVEETISTLQFANRAKAIKNKPEVNAVATDATKLQDLTKQLSRLQSELATKNLIEQDNRNLMKQISGLQKMILNGFGQRSVDIGGCRRKTWCAPRRVTISTLHVVDEDKETSIPKFRTPTLKYNPMSLPNARDFQPIQRATQLEPVSEEITMITPPPKDKKVNFSDEIIELDSDEEDSNTSNTSRCSPYHKCYNSSKTPPCILRKNAKVAEKNLKDIVELTNREKMYNPDVVEYMEKLEQSTATIASLEENLKKLSDTNLEKDSEFELLKYKITQTENEIKTISTAKEALEALCKEYNTKITDLEVSYENLKMKAKLREDELLCLLNEQTSTKKPKDYGKTLSGTFVKEFDFMDLSKDISLVSDHDSSIDTSNTAEIPVPLQELVTDMNIQMNDKNQVIEHLENNLLEQKRTIESLESTCRELREQILRSDTTLEHTVEENSMLKSSIEILNSTIKAQKQSLETADSDVQSCNSLIQELQSKLIEKNGNANLNISDNLLESMLVHEETFIANNENLKNIIQSFKIALDARTKEIVSLKSGVSSQTSELQVKEEQINKLVEELQKSKEQLDENMNVINKLMQENESLVKHKDENSEKLFIAEKQKLEMERTNIELQKQNDEYNRQLRDFNENHDKVVQNLNKLKNNLTILQKEKEELSGLQNIIHSEDMLISDLKSEVQSNNNIISSLNSKQAELQGEVTMKNNLISNLKSELLTKDNLISSLSSEHAESQDKLCNFKSLEYEIEKLRTEVETLGQDKNKLQNDKSILNQELIQLKENVELLQNELEQLNKENSDLIADLQVTNVRIQDLTDSTTTKDHLITSLRVQEGILRSRIEEILQQDLKLQKEMENLQLLVNANQTKFNEQLQSKEDEVINLKNSAGKRENMLDENYIELQKISKTLDETVKNRDQILDHIYTAVANLIDKQEIQSDLSLNSASVYRSILQILDKVEEKVSSLKYKTTTHDTTAKELEETKLKCDQLQKELKEVMDILSRSENKNKLLIAELDESKIANSKLSDDLLKGDEILKQLQVELRDKNEVIESLELKCNKWNNNFVALEESMKMQIMELQSVNLELQSQCSQKDSNETYSVEQVSSVSENHQLADRKSLTNILVEPGNTSPQSLLTLCCNTIIDTINPSESKSETPSSSTVNFEAISVETQTHPCDCDRLMSEKDVALDENMDLKAKLEFLQLVNVNLLKEQEEIRKELKLLVEPAHELQKKVSNHRTNLSTLTATTYAENKLLKSQVKVLQHHNNRFHSVCQKDLPAFKKSLQELSSILKSTSLASRLETSIKRYSLPEVLDRNTSASNFRDESTLDSELLMLDTNVTLASADNTLLVQDQTVLDSTQVFLETEINTDLIIDPNILHTQLQILSVENQKLTEKFKLLKEENFKLHKRIDDSTDSVKPDIRKIDAQSSPIKQNQSLVIESLEDTDHINGEHCKHCGSKNLLALDIKVAEEIKSLTEELLHVKLQNADFEKKCFELNADIIENDKLVSKINALETKYNVKTSEVDKLTKKLEEFNKLQEENDLLSTQVMESIDEADDLKRELDILKVANVALTDKCTELEQFVKCTKAQLTSAATCLKCSQNTSASPTSSHSVLNRSRSDSESTSCFNKLSTLQNELLASREDCKTISEDVATIKSHFDLGNMSMSHNMELDDSMGEHNMFTFPKELSKTSPKAMKLKEAVVPKERRLDIYDLDRIDCFNYYVEKTGAETNLNEETKIIDVMKMLYNSLIAKHGNEVENLVNKLKDFEESRNELHKRIAIITSEHSKINEEIKDKDNHINNIANIFSKIRLNLTSLNEEISSSDVDKNTALVAMFKDKLLDILDSEFEVTSVCTFEKLVDKIVSKHQTDLLEVMTRYSELQGNMEVLTSELSSVTDNLSQIKCQLSNKEKEYNLLKSHKKKMHEISNAVTLDIVQKDQELNDIISKGCEILLKSKIVTPSEIDLSLPPNKNISVLIEKLVHQSKQIDLVSQEKHNLLSDVTRSKAMLEENEEEIERLKSEIEKLRELCKNATSELVIKNEALETLSSLHEQLKEVYDRKTEENNTNVNIIERLTQELVIVKENMVKNENALLAIQLEKQEKSDSETKAKIAELVESINDLEHENKKLKSVNEMIKTESEQNTLQLAKADDAIKHNKTELDKMTAEILSLNLSLKESLSVIESLKLEAKALLQENDNLTKQFEEVNKLCSQLKLNIKTHEKTTEIQCKTIARLKQEKENSMTPGKIRNKQIEELTQKCETLRKECVTLTTELDKTKQKASELKEEKELLERKMTELEAQIESTQKSRVSLGSIGDNSRRRRQSLLDSKRIFGEDKQELDHKKMEAFFSTSAKPEEMFMDVDDNSNRSTPVRGRRSGSFQSKNEESDRDEGGSRPGSALARRRRRQSLHDMHRVTQHTPDHLNTLDENNKLDSDGTSEVTQLKERLELCQQELEDLREKYREVDAECETCAEYLRERDEQCMQLTNHNKALQQQLSEVNEKLQNASMNRQNDSKRSLANASVNTDEDWANLHSVVVDRMSFDREVEKNKSLQRCVDELRFKNSELKTTLAKMQKSTERAARNKADIKELEATKLELQTCKRELEECRERCKELDEECETCGAYLRERDEQLCRLKEAKDALEAKIEALIEKEAGNKAMSVRKKRQSMHDQNRNSTVQCADASTETSDDILSYQVERDSDSMLQHSETQQLKMAVERLSQQKTAMELQMRAMTSAVPMMPPVYVATGSAIVQNQHLTDIMKENQKLKKMNAKLITICKKRGKPLGESNRENDDPAEMG